MSRRNYVWIRCGRRPSSCCTSSVGLFVGQLLAMLRWWSWWLDATVAIIIAHGGLRSTADVAEGGGDGDREADQEAAQQWRLAEHQLDGQGVRQVRSQTGHRCKDWRWQDLPSVWLWHRRLSVWLADRRRFLPDTERRNKDTDSYFRTDLLWASASPHPNQNLNVWPAVYVCRNVLFVAIFFLISWCRWPLQHFGRPPSF